ncbi:MAG: hypothetical protein E5X80_11075 [Mesorhizobium sp.]|uniref:hypothetical protein n=1 Tax=Mesorhizobium sp. TaxID=1871066 RepID=UPI0011FCF750|nr:hypothetical protein [Mesorhizobium sp.]TIO52184.1 MAG: hypothetical protein E5X78_13845 [Mesorhizobium sp.]TIO60848.1 MAG: hypothetical protein E5X79_10420 [Mesorhizobium sp.]TJV65394.1 MAG: hypothetical protein E5X80_11075 [Mesorhizobium sp.]
MIALSFLASDEWPSTFILRIMVCNFHHDPGARGEIPLEKWQNINSSGECHPFAGDGSAAILKRRAQ